MSDKGRDVPPSAPTNGGAFGEPRGPGIRDSAARHADVDLDAAIDMVAREMTNLDAPAAWRVRVMDRIGGQKDGFRVPFWALGAPRGTWSAAAAMVAIVVAAGVWIEHGELLRGPAVNQVHVADLNNAAPGPHHPPPPPSTQGRAADVVGSGPGHPLDQPLNHMRIRLANPTIVANAIGEDARGDVAEEADFVHALADIEPLTFSAVGPAALNIPSVEVAPLGAVPTLDVPSLNPGSTDTRSPDPKKEPSP